MKQASVLLMILASGCAGIMKYDKSDQLKDIKEFDSKVKIEVPATAAPTTTTTTTPSPAPGTEVATTNEKPAAEVAKDKIASKRKSKRHKKTKVGEESGSEVAAVKGPPRHEPELEGQADFVGRRPLKDPFRVGEKVYHDVTYFNVSAGTLELGVAPYALVNGQKNYQFTFQINSSSLFSKFYSVDDNVVSLMNYETMLPSVYTLHIKESGQLKESRFLMDWPNKKADYWEKKVTKKDGPEERKEEWPIADYAQDVFSAAFYVRCFSWEVGTKHAFRVADNKDNLIFRAEAIRKEKLSTDAGVFDAIVIKPQIELAGQYKPMGDIFVWLSDDEHHYILRIESKIKIGTLVSEVTKIEPGKEP